MYTVDVCSLKRPVLCFLLMHISCTVLYFHGMLTLNLQKYYTVQY